MPVYKVFILNNEISLNYEPDQKNQLVEAIKSIKMKLSNYDNLNGKISDNKLLCLLSIKLQAEILEINNNKEKENHLNKKNKSSDNKNLSLNNKLYQLQEQNKLLKQENELVNNELSKIQNQIDLITHLIKQTYEE